MAYKLLISLVRQTPEWLSPDARVLVARACDASGDTELARVMRCLAHSSTMTKRHMLRLMREWGYRSDIWRPKLGGGGGGGGVTAKDVSAAEKRLDALLAAASSDMVVDGALAASAGRALRCLDSAHGPGCTLCVPAAHLAPASRCI